MRLFSFPNILLILVILATREGAHLDGLLTPSQMQWVNTGAKVVLTGKVDEQSMAFLTRAAAKQAAQVPQVRNYQPYNFVERSGAQAAFVPANLSMPIGAALPAGLNVEALVGSIMPQLMGS